MVESIAKGFKMGAYACLYKPFDVDELIRYIEEIDRKKFQHLLGERIDM